MNNVSPRGFRGVAANIGLKRIGNDFTTIVSEVPSLSTAIFARSRFAGPSVVLSRASAAARRSRGVVVLAGNANVATGCSGGEHAAEVRARVADLAGVPPGDLMISSTGVIGTPYPMDVVRRGLERIMPLGKADFEASAAAMMTGDAHRKSVHRRCGDAALVGIAKGGGWVEHDRVTRLTFFFTDATLPIDDLDEIFRTVMSQTFNELNMETDTATSDTAALFANGLAGSVAAGDFERVLRDAAVQLARQIASENEGATKQVELEDALAGTTPPIIDAIA